MEHDESYEDTWDSTENDWLPHVKNDVLSIAFCYARCNMGMEELIKFGMKNNLTLPSLAKKSFDCLRDENVERVYTYTDPFIRKFVHTSIKGGGCNSFIQP